MRWGLILLAAVQAVAFGAVLCAVIFGWRAAARRLRAWQECSTQTKSERLAKVYAEDRAEHEKMLREESSTPR